jgi:hypothetical protein
MANRRQILIPESRQALKELKDEIATQLGIYDQAWLATDLDTEFATEWDTPATTKSFDWGQVSSRDAGSVGGRMTARFIEVAQQTLLV